MTRKIDSHQHLWKVARGDYGWLTPALAPIYRDFLPDDLTPLLAAAGVEKTVLVQATETAAETQFMLDLAVRTDWISGVVGWADMEAPDAPDTIAALAENPLLKGIRPMIQDMDDDEWILRASTDAAFDALIAHGLTFDALVLPRHLSHLRARLDRHPDLRCVIDHGAKPEIATGNITDWAGDMADLAAHTNTLCKLSGLVTEAGDDWQRDDLEPVIAHLFSTFGAGRLMFGSDWPVLNLAGSYLEWTGIADGFIKAHAGDDAALVWAENAANFYRLDE